LATIPSTPEIASPANEESDLTFLSLLQAFLAATPQPSLAPTPTPISTDPSTPDRPGSSALLDVPTTVPTGYPSLPAKNGFAEGTAPTTDVALPNATPPIVDTKTKPDVIAPRPTFEPVPVANPDLRSMSTEPLKPPASIPTVPQEKGPAVRLNVPQRASERLTPTLNVPLPPANPTIGTPEITLEMPTPPGVDQLRAFVPVTNRREDTERNIELRYDRVPPPPTPVSEAPRVNVKEPTTSPVESTTPVHEQIHDGIVSQAKLVQHARGTDFILELHPPELGKVHVHLQTSQEGLSARLIVADEVTRTLIEGQMEQLRQKLSESACPVVRCSISDMAGHWQSRQQHQQGRQPHYRGNWRTAEVVDSATPLSGNREGLDVMA
jgi:hypothetical protein